MQRAVLAFAAIVLPLAAVADTTALASDFAPTECPSAVAARAACFVARDAHGAWLLAAMPKDWNRRLVVHAHGGPRLGTPQADDGKDDLERFAVMVNAGHAWIGSTYRKGGYGVRRAAEDAEHSRQAFVARWGKPQRTLLHGQSWGGNVAAKMAELYAFDAGGAKNYDGVLTTNGVLFGGTQAYGFRADLRAVYQFYCNNHPRPDEPQYPLWQGLPTGTTLPREALRARVDACTGIDTAPDQRTPEQSAHLADILAVIGVAERELVAHLNWGTYHFQDLVGRVLEGRNPFDNTATAYRGSRDDTALNAGIARYTADPQAVARLAWDADLSGQIVLPMLTVHALGDPTVSHTAQAAYAATVARAGRSALLAQVTTDEHEHSRLRDATYATALAALNAWLDGGPTPDGQSLQARCLALAGDGDACSFASAAGAGQP